MIVSILLGLAFSGQNQPLITSSKKFFFTSNNKRSVIYRVVKSDPTWTKLLVDTGKRGLVVLSLTAKGDACTALLRSPDHQELYVLRLGLDDKKIYQKLSVSGLGSGNKIVDAQVLSLGADFLVRVSLRKGLSPESTRVKEWIVDVKRWHCQGVDSGIGAIRLAESAGGLVGIDPSSDVVDSNRRKIILQRLLFNEGETMMKPWVIKGDFASIRHPITINGAVGSGICILTGTGYAYEVPSGRVLSRGVFGAGISREMLYDWNSRFLVLSDGAVVIVQSDGRVEIHHSRSAHGMRDVRGGSH